MGPTYSKGQVSTQSHIHELNHQIWVIWKGIAWKEQEFNGLAQAGKEEACKLLKELWAMEATLEVEIWEPPVAQTLPASPTAVSGEDHLMGEAGPSAIGSIPNPVGTNFPQEDEAWLESIKASTLRSARERKTSRPTLEEIPEVGLSKRPCHGMTQTANQLDCHSNIKEDRDPMINCISNSRS